MDNDRVADGAYMGGIKVEGAIEVLPGRHVRGEGGLAEEVQYELRLREELVPQEVGEGIVDYVKDRKEVGSEGGDSAFGYIEAMDIRRDNLESAVQIFNDGATIINTGLVVKDLEIDAVAFGIEARHDAVVGINTIAVVA